MVVVKVSLGCVGFFGGGRGEGGGRGFQKLG